MINTTFYFDYNGTAVSWNYKGDYTDNTSPIYKAYNHKTYKPRLNDLVILETHGHDKRTLKQALLESINANLTWSNKSGKGKTTFKSIWTHA